MGDRGNIKIQKDGGCFTADVYLYTHWGGSELKHTLAAALDRGRGRWCDGSYLARIIFNQMTKHYEMETTSFGISTVPTDNEYPFLVVNIKKQVVFEEADIRPGFNYPLNNPEDAEPVSFEEFVKKHKT